MWPYAFVSLLRNAELLETLNRKTQIEDDTTSLRTPDYEAKRPKVSTVWTVIVGAGMRIVGYAGRSEKIDTLLKDREAVNTAAILDRVVKELSMDEGQVRAPLSRVLETATWKMASSPAGRSLANEQLQADGSFDGLRNRVEALARVGELEEANRLARRLVDLYPNTREGCFLAADVARVAFQKSGDRESLLRWVEHICRIARENGLLNRLLIRKLNGLRAISETSADCVPDAGDSRKETERVVASLLAVDPGDVRVGPDVSFVESDGNAATKPWAWEVRNFPLGRFERALFVYGRDSLLSAVGGGSWRVDCLWRREDAARAGARAGIAFNDPVGCRSGGLYVLSFSYRTKNLVGIGPGLSLVKKLNPVIGNVYLLPDTRGDWKEVFAVYQVPESLQGSIAPLLENFGVGCVYFEDFHLQGVKLRTAVKLSGALLAVQ